MPYPELAERSGTALARLPHRTIPNPSPHVSRARRSTKRLDAHNGLLLSALWDTAFDSGMVGFTDDGKPCVSPSLSEIARHALAVDDAPALLGLRDAHRANLAVHRKRH